MWGRKPKEDAEVTKEPSEALDKVRRLAHEVVLLGEQWERELAAHKREGHARGSRPAQ